MKLFNCKLYFDGRAAHLCITSIFRLDSGTVDKMRKEAEEKEVSVNTLVSQIIRNHFDWHSIAPRAGFISVRRPLVKSLLDKHTDEEIRSLAHHIGKTSNRDYLLLLRSKVSLDSAIDFFESWLRACGFAYRREQQMVSAIHFSFNTIWERNGPYILLYSISIYSKSVRQPISNLMCVKILCPCF